MVANLWKHLRHDARMYRLAWQLQFKAASKLRAAFTLQVIGMVVNNVGLIAAWWFLFARFGTINGWNGLDFIGMQGMTMLVFGVVTLVSAGISELPRYVDQGSFDTYLTKPSSVLMQVGSSAIEVPALGDIALGLILIIWYAFTISASFVAILLCASVLVIGMILLWCFTLLSYLLAFYIFDSDKVGRNIAAFYLDLGIYPSGVLSGGLRTFMLTVFPGMFMGVVPLEVLRDANWRYVLLGLVVALFWLAVSLWLFRRSLKKYESANLVGAR